MGKVATKGQKKIHEDNISTLKFYKTILYVTNIVYYLLTITLFYSSFTALYITLSTFASSLSILAYQFMSYMSTPSFAPDDRGNTQLTDAGLDLNIKSGGVAEHAKDMILACCLVQALSLFHNSFWLLLLFLPARGLYLLWVNILAPWIFDPNQEPEINEKKQRKLERRQKRMANAGR